MIYLIWASIVSIIAIVVMISYRYYELSYNREILSTSFRGRSDQKILTFWNKNIILLNRLYQKNIKYLSKVVKYIGHKGHNVWQLFSRKVDSFFEKVKGKKTMNKKGSVSLYWQSVSQNKNDKRE